jgi:hypothetical protein
MISRLVRSHGGCRGTNLIPLREFSLQSGKVWSHGFDSRSVLESIETKFDKALRV